MKIGCALDTDSYSAIERGAKSNISRISFDREVCEELKRLAQQVLLIPVQDDGSVAQPFFSYLSSVDLVFNLACSSLSSESTFVRLLERLGVPFTGSPSHSIDIANNKSQLEFGQALALGILCNALVCMAIWLTLGGRTTTDKIMAILFPITAFGAAGFEHSVANMYFIPSALLIKTFDPEFAASTGLNLDALTLTGFFNNMIPVTIGNIIGGVVMVGAIYWFVYLREK
ncbi:MAG: formate/nitrite transporter family protein [Anaerolineae bacterium]|nr:formate/nitrite transporter family protein [Anaerolineae bacterium]